MIRMLSQKEKATITRKYQKRMKSACQNLLAKRYGVDKVEPYWQKVEERYNQILMKHQILAVKQIQ